MKATFRVSQGLVVLVVVLGGLCLFVESGYATDEFEWTGAGSDSLFSNADNWTNAAAPIAGQDNSYDFSGVSGQTITNDVAGAKFKGGSSYYTYLGSNTITGDSYMDVSSLHLDSRGGTIDVDLVIASGGTAIGLFFRYGTVTFSGDISGAGGSDGAIRTYGNTHITLSGTNTFTQDLAVGHNGNGATVVLKNSRAAGAGGITITGNNTLSLDGTDLDITNSIAFDASGNGSVTSAVAYTLSGAISGNGTLAAGLTLGSAGSIAPGTNNNGIGTIYLEGAADLDGELLIDVNAAGESDLLDVAGNLDIATCSLTVTNLDTLGRSNYVFVTYGGSLTGASFASEELPEGFWVDYNYEGGGNIALCPDPLGTVVSIK